MQPYLFSAEKCEKDRIRELYIRVHRFEEDRNTCQLFNDRAGVLLNSTTDEGLALNLDLFMAETQTFIDGYPFAGR